MVHQTGLADTAVAEDDDLVFLSAFPRPVLALRVANLQQDLFARSHFGVVDCVEVAVVAEVGDLAVRRYGRANGDVEAGRIEKLAGQTCE